MSDFPVDPRFKGPPYIAYGKTITKEEARALYEADTSALARGTAIHEEADRILRDTPLIDPATVAAQLVAWSELNLTEEK